MKVYLLLILLFLNISIYSQIGNNDFANQYINIIPKSPDVSSLGKFIETPVNLYNGLPNVSVPLYQINEGKINLPISINYHASGVRVNEHASWVGIGWSLNAGGMVSRTVRGIADDAGDGFYSINNNLELENILYNNFCQEANIFFNDVLDYSKDLEPDVYYYILPNGESGSFFFSGDGQIIPNPSDENKIDPILDGNSKFSGWNITTNDGTLYRFGISEDLSVSAIEIQTSQIISGSKIRPVPSYVSSWFLNSITDVLNNTILFEYEPYYIINGSMAGQDKVYWTSPLEADGFTPNANYVYYRNEINGNKIKKIIFKNGTVQFNQQVTKRLDSDDNALSSIVIKNKNNVVLKSVDFDYTYTISSSPTNFSSFLSGIELDEFTHRLFLNSVQEKFSDDLSLTKPPYIFDYDDTILPAKFSFSQDFWGYYNGQFNTSFVTEYDSFMSWLTFDFSRLIKDGSNKRAYIDYTEAGVLKKITYPTGGFSLFDYESNKAGNPGYEVLYAHREENLLFQNNFWFNNVTDPNVVIETAIFSIDENTILQRLFYEMNIGYNGIYDGIPYTCTEDPLMNRGCGYYKIEINGISDSNSDIHIELGLSESQNIQHTQRDLPIGDYELYIEVNTNTLPVPESETNLSIRIYSEKYVDGQVGNYNVGGLRIKKITTQKTVTDLYPLIKEYSYTMFNNSSKSSGLFASRPRYLKKSLINTDTSSSAMHFFITNNSINPFTSSANSFGYTNVTEKQMSSQQISGKKEFTFSFNQEFQIASWVFRTFYCEEKNFSFTSIGYPIQPEIIVPSLFNNITRGNLINLKIYNNINTFYSLIKEKNIIYDYIPRFGTRVYKIYPTYNTYPAGDHYDLRMFPSASNYFIQSLWKKLNSETTKDYFDSNFIETETQYFYDVDEYNGRIFPTQTKTTTSQSNKTIITKTDYAHDLLGQESHMQKLIDANRIAEPIQIKTYEQIGTSPEILLSTQKTTYQEFGANNLLLPNIIQTSKGENDNDPENRIIYHNYDDYGNPTEVSKTGNSKHIFYIWGYNHSQPIAKIEGVTASQIATIQTEINTAINKSDLDDDTTTDLTGNEGQLRIALNALRNHTTLSHAMTTTFTYNPLIGITSITDPKGDTQYYIYDTFNRLQFVKDQEGNILKENQYHYRQ